MLPLAWAAFLYIMISSCPLETHGKRASEGEGGIREACEMRMGLTGNSGGLLEEEQFMNMIYEWDRLLSELFFRKEGRGRGRGKGEM